MTLTELSIATKRTLFWFIVLVFSFYLLKFVFLKTKSLYLTLNPPELPPAEAGFGNAPKIDFDVLSFAEGSFPEYILDTKTGKLPSFPDRALVYKLYVPIPRISAEKEAKEFAKSVNLWWNPTKKSLIEFTWQGEENKRSLYFNITTKKIVLETNIEWLSSNLSSGFVLSSVEAQNRALEFFRSRGLLSEDLENAEIKTSFVKADKNTLRETGSYLQANIVRVDFFRKVKSGEDTDNLVYGTNPVTALVSLYTSNPIEYEKRSDLGLVYPLLYYQNPKIFQESSAYPIISIEKAWEYVKNGSGEIVYLKKNTDNFYDSYTPLKVIKMEIRDITLAYYQPQEPTPLLQPIYVFEGVFTTTEKETGKFYIYVQALDPQYINF
ncbi:MAG: hypothetical protein ABIB98_00585 [bacterium]